MNTIVNYYTEQYDESKRLDSSCDNRHKTEIINKAYLITSCIEQILSQTNTRPIKIIDVGAGVGYWTDFILKKWKTNVEIHCGDIVPKHNSIMYQRFENYDNVHVTQMNALNLNHSMYGIFDMVICGGPMYHLNDTDSTIAATMLLNVCKPNGLILVDWLPEAHGAINWSLMKNTPVNNVNEIDGIFHYKTSDKVTNLFSGFKILGHYGIDSITRFIEDKINQWNDSQLELYCETIRKHWNLNPDLSEHAISIIQKTPMEN